MKSSVANAASGSSGSMSAKNGPRCFWWVRPSLQILSRIEPCLRCHQVQGYIPGVRRQGFHPLAFVGDAHQPGAVPAAASAQVGEGAVVVAAAHAEPVTPGVEADEGDQQQVQGPGESDPPVAQTGLGNAEAVVDQGVARPVGQEPEPSPGVGSKRGQEAEFAPRLGQPHQGQGIDFAVGAPVKADAAGAQEEGLAAQQAGKGAGVAAMLGGAERATGALQAVSEGAGGGHGGSGSDIPRRCRRDLCS